MHQKVPGLDSQMHIKDCRPTGNFRTSNLLEFKIVYGILLMRREKEIMSSRGIPKSVFLEFSSIQGTVKFEYFKRTDMTMLLFFLVRKLKSCVHQSVHIFHFIALQGVVTFKGENCERSEENKG